MAKTLKQKSVAGRTLYHYAKMWKKYKGYTAICLITTPLVIFVRSIFQPLILADMIGKISEGLPADKVAEVLLPEGIFLLFTYALSNLVLEKIRLWSCWKMEILSIYDLDTISFNTVCEQSMQFHNDRFSGSLVSQINKFTGSFERFCDVIIWDVLPWIVSIIFYVIVLYPRAPLFTICLISFIFIYVLIAGLTSRRLRDLSEKEAASSTKLTGQLADSITNITAVKSYAKENHERQRYAAFQTKWRTATFNMMGYTIKRDILFSSVNIGLVAVIILFMIHGQTWFGISVSTLVLIINYSQQVMTSLWGINSIFKNIMRAFGDAREMTEILDLPDDVVDADNAYELKVTKGDVTFAHVNFRHADAKEKIFEDFSLEVKPGERIGLVGISGSGKTTLTKLLLRFADVNSGEISIDGQDIRDVTQSSLRTAIAYVPQESALFHRSIADNIAYAKPDAEMSEIIRAAKLANADEFIKDTPDGYATLVGERGIKLSGGQRQRISIARAILKDAPVLVLDEATSALDSESENLIQDALRTLMKGRTSIVIAHRLSTVAELDRIVVLDHGKIIEQGSHADLLKKNGTYAKLWSRQSGAFMSEGGVLVAHKPTLFLISDLHFSHVVSHRRLARILAAAREAHPTHIIITGDLVDSTNVFRSPKVRSHTISYLAELAQIAPVFLTLGNHEFRHFTRSGREILRRDEKLIETLSSIPGVHLLDNKEYRDDQVYLYGFTAPLSYWGGYRLSERVGVLKDALAATKFHTKKNLFNLFLFHSPIHLANPEVQRLLAGFDYTVSGHMHDGLVPDFLLHIWRSDRGFVSPGFRLFNRDARLCPALPRSRRLKLQKHTKNEAPKRLILGSVTPITNPHILIPLSIFISPKYLILSPNA